ncbi:uncharacterized protein LOC127791035 [Diospyros lotus]|uniref:uncharacterized protein LOC127791035 n=1 Tax=Diospyros lotus TaxID=55363 RepID=UPI002259F4D2|nr:uncharacterized protein LOC127791035 [Diospyros lotus]
MDAPIPADGSGATVVGVASGSNPPLLLPQVFAHPLPLFLQQLLFHILKEDCPVVSEENMTTETVAAREAWMHSDFLCKNYILSGLADSLYNVYCTAYATSKQLWETLEKKYKLEDAGTKKFLVGKFLDYKMVDTKLVVNQMEELQIIISDLHSEGLVINEPFQVVAVIEKLPPSWKDFKNYLKHKRKELSMEDLALRLRIEEDNRKGDKVSDRYEAKAHLAEALKSQPKKQQGKKVT